MAIAQQSPATGGMFGAIRSLLLADPAIVQQVGNRVSPGRISSGWSSQNASATTPVAFPTVVISDVGSSFSHDVYYLNQRVDVYDTTIQISIFGNSYEQARQLSLYVHGIIRQPRYINVDGVYVWIQPLTSHQLLTPKRSEAGADVWQMSRRYRFWQQDGIVPINSQTSVKGSGYLNLPGISAAGQGST